MQPLDELQNWFPSGTAEGERAILQKVFVYVNEFNRILSPRTGSPYLLIGRKGSGKSAIIDFAYELLQQQKVPTIILRPSDIPTNDLTDQDSIGDLIRKFYDKILNSIAAKLAERNSNGAKGDEAIIYNAAVNSGQRTPDFLSRVAKLLPTIARPLIGLDRGGWPNSNTGISGNSA